MTDDTGPKTRQADSLMTMTIRNGRIGTVLPLSLSRVRKDTMGLDAHPGDILTRVDRAIRVAGPASLRVS